MFENLFKAFDRVDKALDELVEDLNFADQETAYDNGLFPMHDKSCISFKTWFGCINCSNHPFGYFTKKNQRSFYNIRKRSVAFC